MLLLVAVPLEAPPPLVAGQPGPLLLLLVYVVLLLPLDGRPGEEEGWGLDPVLRWDISDVHVWDCSGLYHVLSSLLARLPVHVSVVDVFRRLVPYSSFSYPGSQLGLYQPIIVATDISVVSAIVAAVTKSVVSDPFISVVAVLADVVAGSSLSGSAASAVATVIAGDVVPVVAGTSLTGSVVAVAVVAIVAVVATSVVLSSISVPVVVGEVATGAVVVSGAIVVGTSLTGSVVAVAVVATSVDLSSISVPVVVGGVGTGAVVVSGAVCGVVFWSPVLAVVPSFWPPVWSSVRHVDSDLGIPARLWIRSPPFLAAPLAVTLCPFDQLFLSSLPDHEPFQLLVSVLLCELVVSSGCFVPQLLFSLPLALSHVRYHCHIFVFGVD